VTKPKYTRGRKIENVHDLIDCVSVGCAIYHGSTPRPYGAEFIRNMSFRSIMRIANDAYVAKERGPLDEFTSAERDVLRQLFKNGPTWDGNITSKTGRDGLFRYKLAEYENGYTQLTIDGLKLCLNAGMRKG